MTTTRSASGRPVAGEFADYATDDIGHVPGEDAVAALTAQADELLAFLTSLDEESVRGLRYAPGKWTLKEVVGHMIDDERIFAYRALCVARSEPRELPGFDENEYVAATRFEHRSLADLAAEYRAVRQATLALFQAFSLEEWHRRGTTNGYSASVRGLAFHLAGHELHHLRVLRGKYFPLMARG
jgi:uncharacterized damage-inducible protein DinB